VKYYDEPNVEGLDLPPGLTQLFFTFSHKSGHQALDGNVRPHAVHNI
jgi:hypothetical protein